MKASFRASTLTRASARSRQPLRSSARAYPRFQSTATPPASSSHVASGVAGGAAVLLLGYGWYYFSGTRDVVSTATSTVNAAKSAKGKLQAATPSLDQALKFLRSTAKSYASAIPGAAGMIDYSFDRLDDLAESHGDEIKKIVNDAYSEVQGQLSDLKGKDAGDAVLKIVNDTVGKLNELASKVDKDYLNPYLEKNPALKKALEGSTDQIKEIANKQGPEARRIRDDILKQLSAIAAGGLTADTAAKAVKLVKEKSEEIKKLAEKTGSEAYKAASKNAQPLLQKLPDVQKLLDEQLPQYEKYIGEDGVKQIKSMYEKLSELSKKKDQDPAQLAKEAEKIVREGLEQAQKTASSALGSAGSAGAGALSASGVFGSLEHLPGFKDIPKLDSLKKIASERGDEATKLVNETYEEIKKVLEDKAHKASKLAEKASKDAKSAK